MFAQMRLYSHDGLETTLATETLQTTAGLR